MRYFDWSSEKNDRLKQERDVIFEDVLIAIDDGRLLDVISHKDTKKYPHQHVLVVAIRGYVYLVPYVEDDEKIFLKTIIPSRKATKKYLIDT